MKRILIIGGTRPNFMKIAPLVRELEKHKDIFDYTIVHTGQHYDANMSQVFFDDLNIPTPHYYLDIHGGTNLQTTGRILEKLEPVLLEAQPNLVLVVGDVNSTLAGAIASKQLHMQVAHIEAGLRSWDLTMPEEINRIGTDSICDYFFTTEPSGKENLLKAGVDEEKIFEVGNLMIDSLQFQLDKNSSITNEQVAQLITSGIPYIVTTFHRPHNVDTQEKLSELVENLNKVAAEHKLAIPLHPRTKSRLETYNLQLSNQIEILPPLGHADFVHLVTHAQCILTDSGGIQEEASYLGIPCLTVRPNTERPVTITHGTNQLIEIPDIYPKVQEAIQKGKTDIIIDLWDGHTAERIISTITQILE